MEFICKIIGHKYIGKSRRVEDVGEKDYYRQITKTEVLPWCVRCGLPNPNEYEGIKPDSAK